MTIDPTARGENARSQPLGEPTAGAIIGTVRDANSGEPLPRILVSSESLGGGLAATNSQGRFLLDDMPEGDQSIVLEGECHLLVTVALTVPTEGATKFEIGLPPRDGKCES
ncbi:MAG: hypothetical protein HKN72_06045 [Gemmatimonadetes bacterium]|nr:hypothetical protein [Gemmatimonadota bacterium]